MHIFYSSLSGKFIKRGYPTFRSVRKVKLPSRHIPLFTLCILTHILRYHVGLPSKHLQNRVVDIHPNECNRTLPRARQSNVRLDCISNGKKEFIRHHPQLQNKTSSSSVFDYTLPPLLSSCDRFYPTLCKLRRPTSPPL